MSFKKVVIIFCLLATDPEIEVHGPDEQPETVELGASVMKSIKLTCCQLLEEEIRASFSPTESDRYSAIIKEYLSTNVNPLGTILDSKISTAVKESVRRNLEEIRPALSALKKKDESKKGDEDKNSDENSSWADQSVKMEDEGEDDTDYPGGKIFEFESRKRFDKINGSVDSEQNSNKVSEDKKHERKHNKNKKALRKKKGKSKKSSIKVEGGADFEKEEEKKDDQKFFEANSGDKSKKNFEESDDRMREEEYKNARLIKEEKSKDVRVDQDNKIEEEKDAESDDWEEKFSKANIDDELERKFQKMSGSDELKRNSEKKNLSWANQEEEESVSDGEGKKFHEFDKRNSEKVNKAEKLEREDKIEKKSFAQALGTNFLSKNDTAPLQKPTIEETQKRKNERAGTHLSSMEKLIPESKEEDTDFNILIIPAAHGGPRVRDELKRLNINLKNFGVIRTVDFLSGAILCECCSLMEKEKLKKVIDKTKNLSVKTEKDSYPNSVRIPNIPIDIEQEEVFQGVVEEFNEEPTEIRFVPYKDSRKYRSKAVIFYVSDELFRVMEANPVMRIRQRKYIIDCSIHIQRCTNCQLLGHGTKFCEAKARPPPLKDENCIDCIFYNEQVKKSDTGNKVPEFRNIKHPTDDEKCPTKLYFISKWRNLRRIGNNARKPK